VIGKNLSHYEILEKLGAGAMGEVYRARDTTLGREVAVKLLPRDLHDNPERRARLESEAKVVAALNHPNIVTVHSIEEADGALFLTMELVEGAPLSRLAADADLSFDTFLKVGTTLADALCTAHKRGIIHRDLKPANIVVRSDGRVKVLDFGMAKVEYNLSDEQTLEPDSADQAIVGTVPYMSPEQLKGRIVGPRSDLFSLGVILFELATGQRPFAGASTAELVSAILRDPPDWSAQLKRSFPAETRDVIDRCLEKDPDLRYMNAPAARRALEDLRRGAGEGEPSGPSVAVLPFADMSPEKDLSHLCEGMAEEIINALTKIDGLYVVSRTSSFEATREGSDSREIGRRLAVRNLLEGSVRTAGDRLRVTAKLITVSDGYNVWSERFDRDMEDVFAVQDEIAESIADALRVTLSPRERRAIQKSQTRNVHAYHFYLHGRKLFYRVQRTGMEFAREMFSRAIGVDPDYALAYAGIADCCSWLYMYFDSNPANLERALDVSRRALELDSDLAEAHAARGLAVTLDGQYEKAESEFRRALELNPHLFEACYFYARTCFIQGRLEKAVRLFEDAGRVNPTDFQCRFLKANALEGIPDMKRALAAYREGVELSERRLQLSSEDVRALYLGAHGLERLGDERARTWIQRALQLDPADPGTLYNVACYHALRGEDELALDFLEKAVDAGYAHREWIHHDAYMKPLRSTSRYQAAMARLG
jgi:non-specific serine/threonine protein kinase